MKKDKIYILLKSLPDNSVCDLFEYNDRTGYYEHDGGTRFLPRIVEDNSEWFTPFNKQEEDRVEISCEGDYVKIKNKEIEYVLPVKTLLELVKHRDELHGVKKVMVNQEQEKKYTEKDMRECFNCSRKGMSSIGSNPFWDFEQYINHINFQKNE